MPGLCSHGDFCLKCHLLPVHGIKLPAHTASLGNPDRPANPILPPSWALYSRLPSFDPAFDRSLLRFGTWPSLVPTHRDHLAGCPAPCCSTDTSDKVKSQLLPLPRTEQMVLTGASPVLKQYLWGCEDLLGRTRGVAATVRWAWHRGPTCQMAGGG